jgi:hypothetical protein
MILKNNYKIARVTTIILFKKNENEFAFAANLLGEMGE